MRSTFGIFSSGGELLSAFRRLACVSGLENPLAAAKRRLEQGPVDHDAEFKCKVYENGRVVASPETLRLLASYSERQIREATGVRRDTIRAIRHGKGVKRSTYEKVTNFLRENALSVRRLDEHKAGDVP